MRISRTSFDSRPIREVYGGEKAESFQRLEVRHQVVNIVIGILGEKIGVGFGRGIH